MPTTRRDFLRLSSVAAMTLASADLSARAAAGADVRVVLFDAFPILDVRSVATALEQEFPGRGTELGNLWRTKQFDYQWLRVLSGNYADFWQVTGESLVFACAALKLTLTDAAKTRLMNAFLSLKAWPDVPAALHALRQSGLRTAFLSNMTRSMLEANVRSAGLDGLIDTIISTDEIRTYKPDVRAYQLGLDVMKVKRQEALFVAFAGWDAAGAKTFGYRTFWANRLKAPAEQLGAQPDFIESDLARLAHDSMSQNL